MQFSFESMHGVHKHASMQGASLNERHVAMHNVSPHCCLSLSWCCICGVERLWLKRPSKSLVKVLAVQLSLFAKACCDFVLILFSELHKVFKLFCCICAFCLQAKAAWPWRQRTQGWQCFTWPALHGFLASGYIFNEVSSSRKVSLSSSEACVFDSMYIGRSYHTDMQFV